MPLPPAPSRPADQLTAQEIEAASAKAAASPKNQIAARLPAGTAAKNTTKKTTSKKSGPATVESKKTKPKKTAIKPAARTAAVAAQQKSARKNRQNPLYVLDTNVLLHDPMALFRFKSHDVFLPLVVLEELDAHKKGSTDVARNGRQTSRLLDALVKASKRDISQGMALNATGHIEAEGLLYFQTSVLQASMPMALPTGKMDNQILGVVQALDKQYDKRDVVLVSKDINMRVKARALGLQAEDYENDKALDDDDVLYSGVLQLPDDFWLKQGKSLKSWHENTHTMYEVSSPLVEQMQINQMVFSEGPDEPGIYTRVQALRGQNATLVTLNDYTHVKQAVWGVMARNREQNFAFELLMDPQVDFVSLAGMAGSGKTLLALAAGLTQVLDERRYTEIIMTRATVSMGEDIGFLPGTEEEKMGPWMGALDDNLEFLTSGQGSGTSNWERSATQDLIRSRIRIKSMNFMRGRTFMNKWVIIDEAQNLTPKQMKGLITRAGPGTKLICMGNLAQIDTPYLTEGSSGLTYVIDRFKDWPHSGHVTLAQSERSRLADFASMVL